MMITPKESQTIPDYTWEDRSFNPAVAGLQRIFKYPAIRFPAIRETN
jgi:hypothetical protein